MMTSQSRLLEWRGLVRCDWFWRVVSFGVLCFEGLLEEPDDDGEVAAFVVGGEQDGVFVADRHCG
jgi:hypothetical protein